MMTALVIGLALLASCIIVAIVKIGETVKFISAASCDPGYGDSVDEAQK